MIVRSRVTGQWHAFCNFASVHHCSGFHLKHVIDDVIDDVIDV